MEMQVLRREIKGERGRKRRLHGYKERRGKERQTREEEKER